MIDKYKVVVNPDQTVSIYRGHDLLLKNCMKPVACVDLIFGNAIYCTTYEVLEINDPRFLLMQDGGACDQTAVWLEAPQYFVTREDGIRLMEAVVCICHKGIVKVNRGYKDAEH